MNQAIINKLEEIVEINKPATTFELISLIKEDLYPVIEDCLQSKYDSGWCDGRINLRNEINLENHEDEDEDDEEDDDDDWNW